MRLMSSIVVVLLSTSAFAGEVAGGKFVGKTKSTEPSLLTGLQEAFCELFFKQELGEKAIPRGRKPFREACRMVTSFSALDNVIKEQTKACQEGCEKSAGENICLYNSCIDSCSGEEQAAKVSKKAYTDGYDAAGAQENFQKFLKDFCDTFGYGEIITPQKHFLFSDERWDLKKNEYRRSEKSSLKGGKVKPTAFREPQETEMDRICREARNPEEAKKAVEKRFEICVEACKGEAQKAAKNLGNEALDCALNACLQRCSGDRDSGFKALDMFGKGEAASL